MVLGDIHGKQVIPRKKVSALLSTKDWLRKCACIWPYFREHKPSAFHGCMTHKNTSAVFSLSPSLHEDCTSCLDQFCRNSNTKRNVPVAGIATCKSQLCSLPPSFPSSSSCRACGLTAAGAAELQECTDFSTRIHKLPRCNTGGHWLTQSQVKQKADQYPAPCLSCAGPGLEQAGRHVTVLSVCPTNPAVLAYASTCQSLLCTMNVFSRIIVIS